MAERDSRDFWDREVAAPIHVTWMEPLVVRHYINESISGEIGTWPLTPRNPGRLDRTRENRTAQTGSTVIAAASRDNDCAALVRGDVPHVEQVGDR
jgi:hypothetical protein